MTVRLRRAWQWVAVRSMSLAAAWGLGGTIAVGADAPRDIVAHVQHEIDVRMIKPHERPFDEIGWASDIRSAEKLAKEHGRPVFLFTHDGHMHVGRC